MEQHGSTSRDMWNEAGDKAGEVLLRASQMATADSELRYRQLIESLPEAVYQCDRDGRVTLFNAAAVRLWGRTPVLENAELWCGSHKMFMCDGTFLPHDECPMAIALREERDFGSIEAVVERPSGERRYVLAHPNLIRDSEGRITGATNVVVDITERKLMEDAMRQVDANKDAFFAMLAHELRNPLAPIVTAASMINMVADDSRVQRAVKVIERQSGQLSRLIEDLLDVSRMSTGAISLQKTVTLLDHVIEIAADVAQPAFDERKQTFSLHFDRNAISLYCDATRIGQVIGNVLVNAAKYTDRQGSIALHATVAGNVLTMEITDNGIGIAQEQIGTIFSLYSQVDGAAPRSQGGMGIGLALVKGLVELHQGTVSVESDGLGCGTRVTLSLPIVLADDQISPSR